MIKRARSYQGLDKYDVYINDTQSNSKYFSIIDFPDAIGGGKSSFLINGTNLLKPYSNVLIEMLDSAGNVIYTEIPQYLENGFSRAVSIYVYDDTTAGLATITILGQLKDAPSDWSNKFNVKWTKTILINPNIKNTFPLKFYDKPTVTVSEIRKNYQIPTYINDGNVVIYNTGSVYGFSSDSNSFYIQSAEDDTIFNKSMLNGKIIVANPQMTLEDTANYSITKPYTSNIIDVINEKLLLVDSSATIVDKRLRKSIYIPQSFDASSFEIQYSSSIESFNTSSIHLKSFAKVDLKNISVFSGDLYKVKVYKKADYQQDYEYVGDYVLESKELLADDNVNAGEFKSVEIFENNWDLTNVSYYELHSDTILESIQFTPYDVDLPSVITYNKNIDFVESAEYTFNCRAMLVSSDIKSYNVNERKLEIYGCGDAFNSNSNYGKLLKTYIFKNNNFSDIDFNFLPDKTGSGTIKIVMYIPVVLDDYIPDGSYSFASSFGSADNWYISNISLKVSQESNFSPDYTTLYIPITLAKRDEILKFKVQLYDRNENKYDDDFYSNITSFVGSNIVIEGEENLISGSLFMGNTLQSGIEFSGKNSAYIRSVGYQGFQTASLFGNSGFIMYSGSVLPGSGDDYTGVGLELHAGLNSGSLRFKANGIESFLEISGAIYAQTGYIGGWNILADKLMSSNNKVYISGSGAISASNFYLDENGNITASNANLSGIISASSGYIGNWKLQNGSLSGSNIILDANGSRIYMASNASLYYIDFTPSDGNNNFVQFGPNFKVSSSGQLFASGAVFEGSISASTGYIGGWQILSSSLKSSNNKMMISGSGVISSSNFYVSENGNLTASNGYFSGYITSSTIIVSTGSLSGWLLSDGYLRDVNNLFRIQVSGSPYVISSSNFQVDIKGNITASNAKITGNISASSGYVGEWQIVSSSLKSANNNMLLSGSGVISSSNFYVSENGNLTASNAKIEGNISASTGYVGHWSIVDGLIKGKNITLDAENSRLYKTNAETNYYLDFTDDGVNQYYIKFGPNFAVSSSGLLVASGATIEGVLTSSEGYIGGWTISPGSLNKFTALSKYIGMSSIGDTSFFAGADTLDSSGSAVFNVKRNGTVSASSGLIGGWTLSDSGFNNNAINLNSNTNTISIGNSTFGLSGIQLNYNNSQGRFYAGDGLNNYIKYDSRVYIKTTDVEISSSGLIIRSDKNLGAYIQATSGSFGGWTLFNNYISSSNLILDSNGSIYTSNYVSGLLGWKITSDLNGYAEFENVKIRGTLSTTVFEKDTVSVIGGEVLVSNATVLSSSVTETDTTWSVDNASGFTNGEILGVKKLTNTGFSTEFILIQSSSISDTNTGAGKLYVLRGYGSSLTHSSSSYIGFNSSTSSSYEAGQSAYSTGISGSGFIRINANPKYDGTPYIDIIERTGSGIYDLKLSARIGDLTGISSDMTYGYSGPRNGILTKNAYLEGAIFANTGSFLGKVHAGNFIFGKGVNSSYNGIYLNSTNYWYDSNEMRIGDSNNYLLWSGSVLSMVGSMYISGGNAVTTSSLNAYTSSVSSSFMNLSSSFNNSLSNVSTLLSSSLTNVSNSFNVSLSNVSNSLNTSLTNTSSSIVSTIMTNAEGELIKTPAISGGSGLYLNSNYMGYYSPSIWNAYISSSGEFLFKKDNNNLLSFTNSAFVLKTGTAVLSGSSIQLVSNNYFLGNANNYISGSSTQLQISSSNFLLSSSGDVIVRGQIYIVGGNAATTSSVTDLSSSLVTTLVNASSSFGTSLLNVSSSFSSSLSKVSGSISSSLSNVSSSVNNTILNVSSSFNSSLSNVSDSFNSSLSNVSSSVNTTILNVSSSFSSSLNTVSGSFSSSLSNVSSSVNTTIINVSSSISSSLSNVSGTLNNRITNVSSSFSSSISNVSSSIVNISSSIISTIMTNADGKLVKTPTLNSGPGLYLNSNYLGYYSASIWNSYISSSGEFLFKKDNNNLLSFGNNIFSLKTGTAVLSGSAIQLVSNNYFLGNANNYISGSSTQLQISSSNFLLSSSGDVIVRGQIFIEGGDAAKTDDLNSLSLSLNNSVNDVSSSINTTIINVSSSMNTSLSTVSGSFNNSLFNVSSSISSSLSNVSSSINTTISNVSSSFSSSLFNVSSSINISIASVSGTFSSSLSNVSSSVNTSITNINTSIINVSSSISSSLSNVSGTLNNRITNVSSSFSSSLSNVSSSVNTSITTISGSFSSSLSNVSSSVNTTIINVSSSISSSLSNVSSSVNTTILNVSSSFSSSLSNVSSSINTVLNNTSSSIVSTIMTSTDGKLVKTPVMSGGSGLYLNSNYMGYYSPSTWNAYISSSGEFLFRKDDNNLLSFGNSTFALKTGTAVLSGSSIQIVSNNFFMGNNNNYISGSSTQLQISSSNFLLSSSGDVIVRGQIYIVGGNAATTSSVTDLSSSVVTSISNMSSSFSSSISNVSSSIVNVSSSFSSSLSNVSSSIVNVSSSFNNKLLNISSSIIDTIMTDAYGQLVKDVNTVDSGLYLNSKYIGYYDSGNNNWPMFISSSGEFLFSVNNNNFISGLSNNFLVKTENAILSGSNIQIVSNNFLLGNKTNYISGSSTGLLINTNIFALSSSNLIISSSGLISASNFYVSEKGNLTASNAIISGAINSNTGRIGGWDIGSTFISASGNLILSSSGEISASNFYVSKTGILSTKNAILSGSVYSTNGYFSGLVSASAGMIGGWTLSTSSLYSGVQALNPGFSNNNSLTIDTVNGISTPNLYADVSGNVGINGTLSVGDANNTKVNFYAGKISKNLITDSSLINLTAINTYATYGSSSQNCTLTRDTSSIINGTVPINVYINTGNYQSIELSDKNLPNLIPGKTYTLSWWGKANSNVSLPLSVHLCTDTNVQYGAPTNWIQSWKRFSFTFVPGNSDSYLSALRLTVYSSYNYVRLWIANVQLEEGIIASPYQKTDSYLNPIYGNELVTDGTLEEADIFWHVYAPSMSDYDDTYGNVLSVQFNQSGVIGYQDLGISFINKTFIIKYKLYDCNGDIQLNLGSYTYTPVRSTAGNYTEVLTVTNISSDTTLYINSPTNFNGYITDISVREVLSNTYGMWSDTGGFGGTMQNPMIALNNNGLVIKKDSSTYNTWLADNAISMGYSGSSWGIIGKSIGNTVFQLGSTNKISQWNFDATKLSSNNIELNSTGIIKLGATADYTSGSGIFMSGSGQFKIGSAFNYIKWDNSALFISGTISSSIGNIGGWTINNNSMYQGSYANNFTKVSINSTTIGNGDSHWNGTNQGQGFQITYKNGSYAHTVTMGELLTDSSGNPSSTARSGWWGLQMVAAAGNGNPSCTFQLSSGLSGSAVLYKNSIANWNFDFTKLWNTNTRLEASSAFKGFAQSDGTNDIIKIGDYDTGSNPPDTYIDCTSTVIPEGGFNNNFTTTSDVINGWGKSGNSAWSFAFDDVNAIEGDFCLQIRNSSTATLLCDLTLIKQPLSAIIQGKSVQFSFWSKSDTDKGTNAGNYMSYTIYVTVDGVGTILATPEITETSTNWVQRNYTINVPNISADMFFYIHLKHYGNNTYQANNMYFDNFQCKLYNKTYTWINNGGLTVYSSPVNYLKMMNGQISLNAADIKVNGQIPARYRGIVPTGSQSPNDIINGDIYAVYNETSGSIKVFIQTEKGVVPLN